jgi:hypothetical protein
VTALEDALRETFQAQAQARPAIDDLANAAIRRGRAVQRWRMASAGLAMAVVLTLVLGGAVSLHGRVLPTAGDEPVGPPAAMPEPEFVAPEAEPVLAQRAMAQSKARLRLIGLDLRVGHQLWTVDGRRLSLSGVGLVTRVYRVPVGWVYGGDERVRLLRTDGSSVALHSGDDRWLVSPDGSRLAAVNEGRLMVSAVAPSGLGKGLTMPIPDGASPVAFAGDTVVIRNGSAGAYDTLVPSAAYQATWNDAVVAVYGSSDGMVFGLVRDGRRKTHCLAALKRASSGLVVAETGGCAAAGPDVTRSRLAPDGRHLAQPVRDRIVLIDVPRALGKGRTVTVVCPVATAVPPAWVDGTTLVASDKRSMVRCNTDGTSQELPLPEGLPSDWDFVPTLTAAKS